MFWKQKILKFFANGPIKFKAQFATVENVKTVWTYLTSEETALKFMNVIGPFKKKIENLLFTDNVVIWTNFFQVYRL